MAASEGVAPFRPLGVGDLLDESIRLFRQNVSLLFLIGLVPLVPAALIQPLIELLTTRVVTGPTAIVAIVVLAAIAGIAAGILGMLSIPAYMHAISERRLGRPATVGSSYRVARRHFWRTLGAGTLTGPALLGMVFTVIGIPFALYFAVGWGFLYHALVIENVGVRRSLGRSRELVRGRWWRTLGIALIFLVVVMIAAMIVAVPIAIASAIAAIVVGGEQAAFQAASSVLSVLLQAVTTPLTYCGWVLYYYDLRVRREGLDLDMPAEQTGA